jgi:tripartite-type tricarboxylate transporter receptor subunit TctC
MNYGSTGTGTSPHLLMEEVAMKAGVAFLHIPFKGNAELTQALMGGHIMAQSDASGWGRFVDAGTFRLLVTFGSQRTKRWPRVPTAKELGLGVVSTSPYGIVGEGDGARVVRVLRRVQEGAGGPGTFENA